MFQGQKFWVKLTETHQKHDEQELKQTDAKVEHNICILFRLSIITTKR